MGDRYILTIKCPKCGYEDDNVYYAPTCGYVDWKCPKCKKKIDLEKWTGISYDDASNRIEIEEYTKRFISAHQRKGD